MEDNLPRQQGTDEKKLQELESELQDLEKRARGELNQPEMSASPVPQNQGGSEPTSQVQQPQPLQGSQQSKAAQESGGPPTQSQVTQNKVSTSGNGGGMKTVMWVGLVVFLLALVGAGGYYLGSMGSRQASTPTPVPQTPSPSPTVSPVSGWSLYQDDSGWSIRYPEDVELAENGATSFVKFGPTQRGGTEFYDGISLTVRAGALGGLSLKDFVDGEVVDIENDPISEVSDGPSAVVVAGLSGYRFTTSGLGTFDYYYLPMGESSYLQIIDATKDPTGQGFEETVQMMLGTIEVGVSLSPSPSPTITASPSASY